MTDINDLDVRRLDGTLLLVFREIMRYRRATVAAQRLRLSQSGVSHALARLREVFGDPLFLRHPHGLEPTGYALEIAPKIEALIALAHDTMGGSGRFDPSSSTRQFQVGAAEFLISLAAAPMLRRIEREAPNASIVFRHFIGDQAISALLRGEIDVAVGQFGSLPDTIQGEVLSSDRFVVLARKSHPALQDGMDVKLFGSLGHVMVSPAGGTVGALDPELAALGVRRRVIGVVPRYLTAFGVVAATDAVVFAPRSLALHYAEGFGLAMIPPPFNDLVIEISAIRLRNSLRDGGGSWLLDCLRSVIAVEDLSDDAHRQAPGLRVGAE